MRKHRQAAPAGVDSRTETIATLVQGQQRGGDGVLFSLQPVKRPVNLLAAHHRAACPRSAHFHTVRVAQASVTAKTIPDPTD